MVLAKLFSAARSRLKPRQVLTLAELDVRLDVSSDRFATAVSRLIEQFSIARASLDLASYRAERTNTASPAALPDFPDFRDSRYQADLRRIAPMDRAEEFRMARRYEFLRSLVRNCLGKLGLEPASIDELIKRPAREILAAVRERPMPRRLDAAWVEAMILQHEELRNLYMEGALYIVLGTVNRYRGLGVDTADLIQEGNASLFQAIDGFDWRRDVRFRTYGQFWVHQAVLKMLYNSSRTVRLPIWVQKVLGKIRRAQEAGRRDGRELSHEEIGKRIGIPAEKVSWVLSTRRYAVSLDAESPREDGGSLAQMLPDDRLLPIPESIPVGDLPKALAEVMADLPGREQGILRRRFGLGGIEPQTLGEIASDLGITAERVRQLQNAAIERMKRLDKLRQLQAYVE
jgi:DNA-directed RNA polymerase sigma subunit (sigma70/sigma32)